MADPTKIQEQASLYDKYQIPRRSNYTQKVKQQIKPYLQISFSKRNELLYDKAISQVFQEQHEDFIYHISKFGLAALIIYTLTINQAFSVPILTKNSKIQLIALLYQTTDSIIAAVGTIIYAIVMLYFRYRYHLPIYDAIANFVTIIFILYYCPMDTNLLLISLVVFDIYPSILRDLIQTLKYHKYSKVFQITCATVFYSLQFLLLCVIIMIQTDVQIFYTKFKFVAYIFGFLVIVAYFFLEMLEKRSKVNRSINDYRWTTITFYMTLFAVVLMNIQITQMLIMAINFLLLSLNFFTKVVPQIKQKTINEQALELRIKNRYIKLKGGWSWYQKSDMLASVNYNGDMVNNKSFIQCMICMNEQSCFVFCDCGHVVIGYDCFPNWLKMTTNKKCLQCQGVSKFVSQLRRVGKTVFSYGIYQIQNRYYVEKKN